MLMEPPRERLAPLRKEREAAKAEEQQQSEELLKQTEAERQMIIWEWQELRGFLEEQEQRLLSRLEELERAIVQRRDEGICRLSWEVSLLSERGGEKGQQPLSQPLQGARSTGSRPHCCKETSQMQMWTLLSLCVCQQPEATAQPGVNSPVLRSSHWRVS
ncbi:zinc finger protein RFP-like isoform X3 [Terrapene carolina triunguis]|uniref:zinc finger protein RFP-like isoform X3 n=1 Tax=Terrapene triunguis TaxID=2587831 RepID=UPI0011565222|nr:zinc finger protein RFP-like isoform X3 [Terrapene carolina triunguis]